MFFEYKGVKPVAHPTAFVHPQANVTGNVVIGKGVYVGPGAAIRGDFGRIVIEDGCNIQENCTIHMFPGVTVILASYAHIGHGAVIHGANIGRNCLIGMNAVIMDNAIIGEESIVGALSFVKANSIFEPRSLIVGNPAKVIKQVSDDMIHWKTKGTEVYQQLARDAHTLLKECSALTNAAEQKKMENIDYKTWDQTK